MLHGLIPCRGQSAAGHTHHEPSAPLEGIAAFAMTTSSGPILASAAETALLTCKTCPKRC